MMYSLDPRSKLLFIVMFTTVVFFIKNIALAAFLILFLIIIRIAAKIPFRGIGHIRTLSLLAVFIVLMQMLFGPGGNYIKIPYMGNIFKWEGFILGLIIVLRVCALFILFPVFTETTPSHKLASGLCALGLNYRSAFIVTTAFNLIPFFREEFIVIMDAQRLRGMNSFKKRQKPIFSFFPWIKAISTAAVPLMLGAMRKAQVSSSAMDSRAFGIYKTRTWLDKPQMKLRDFFFISACTVFTAFILFLNYCKIPEWQRLVK